MIFFDYIYYESCNWYYKYKSSRNEYKPSGLILTCGYIGFNVVQLIILFEYFFDIKLIDSKYEILFYMFPVALPFIIRYWNGEKYESTHKKVIEWSDQKKIIMKILRILYVIISAPGMVVLAVYIHKLKNGG